MIKFATTALLVLIMSAYLVGPSQGFTTLPGNGCTSCIGGSLISYDQDFDSATNASISLSVAVANGGTCDPENGCAHQTPCVFAYSQVINVGQEGGTIGYKYETSGAGGSQAVNATRSSVPPGGPAGGAVNSQIDVDCGTSFIYTVSILTATTQTFLIASVNGTCSGCTEILGD